DYGHKPVLAVERRLGQLLPAAVSPALVPMRPDPSHNQAIEAVEELANVGKFVILTPSPQQRVKFRYQLLGLQRYPPFGPLPELVHETTDRFLLGIRIQRSLSDLTTNLALGQMELPLPALDFVAEEFEAIPDMNDPRLLRM